MDGRDKVRGGEGQMSARDAEKKKNTVIKVMIHRAGHKAGRGGKETSAFQGEI